MPEPELVSVVVPCYNPVAFLRETLASIAAQTHPRIETIVVNDGTHVPESLELLKEIAGRVDVYLEQPNRGLAAARNTGYRAAKGRFIVPLDADDLIQPEYVEECLAALKQDESAAFAYTDYQVFGTKNYPELTGEYDLYKLLDRNFLAYASMIRKKIWEEAGGYDESMRLGYEDWEFWLRLGSRGFYGHHVGKILFHYRKHGASLYDIALSHHDQLIAYIQGRHPELYQAAARRRIKAQWAPAVVMVAAGDSPEQTIQDVFVARGGDVAALAARFEARAVVVSEGGTVQENTAEMAALAVWSGHESARLPGGARALSRRAAMQPQQAAEPDLGVRRGPGGPPHVQSGSLWRHLENAELLSWRSWALHPARSAARLIPLRVKERVNQRAGRPVFDLSFYMQFQPKAVVLDFGLVELLEYFPAPAGGKQRVAVVVPHLGAGGAESVLLDILGSLDRERFEVLVLATQSKDRGWERRWKNCGAHVYDLATVVLPERMVSAICSIVKNWECQTVLVQNSLYGYAALPYLKRLAPETRTIDVIHAIDDTWDQVAASSNVAAHLDLRVAVSDAVKQRLLDGGTPAEAIRVIHAGVDLTRFRGAAARGADAGRILFAGRLDAVKRPLLLVEIAEKLRRRRPEFRFVIAGDGPELGALRERVKRKHLEMFFEFLGAVDDLAPVLESCDIVILPSRSEGVPLVLLEALACARPVVASRVGGIPQVIDAECGVLIEMKSGETAEFAAALDTLLGDPVRREKMGQAGRARVEAGYDLRASRREYAEILKPGQSPAAA